MNNDKIITYADLALIEDIEAAYGERGPGAALLARLRAAAEADAPPLPEGWVLWETPSRTAHRVVWHSNGCLYVYSDCSAVVGDFNAVRDRLTPLRPAIDAETLEKMARAARAAYHGGDNWDDISKSYREIWLRVVHAALAADGIEVSES